MLADDLIAQITQSLHSAEYRNLPGDVDPIEFATDVVDPVARLTEGLDKADDLFPGIDQTKASFFTDPPKKVYRSQGFQQDVQETRDNPELLKTPQHTEQTYTQRSWFKQWGGGPNGDLSGFIPQDALKKIEGGNHFMRPDAAKAWKALNRAARKDGIDITITDSYRSYDAQVRLKEEKPSLSATPGHSNHGWGLANDVNVNDPQVYEWLKNNAKRFGFEQPMDYEPWHWEYGGGFVSGQGNEGDGARNRVRGKRIERAGLNKVTSSLVTAPMVFGSILGEVYEPKMKRPGRPAVNAPQGLGFVPAKYRSIIKKAADEYGLSARLLATIAKHESGFDPNAVSSAGAQGLFQVMPLHGLGDKAFNPRANAMKAASIFANYLNLANGNLRLALAYYNAGPYDENGRLRPASDPLMQARMKIYADPILREFRGVA